MAGRHIHLKPALRQCILAAAITFSGTASAQQGAATTPSNPPGRAVYGLIDANEQIQSMFKMCPADTYRRANANGLLRLAAAQTRLPQCISDPTSCYDACVAGSGSACFNLARSFQQDEKAVPQRYAEMLFTTACGFGHAGGCTNRGSGIRNSLPYGDPFRAADEKSKDACQFRTFRLSCGQGDAWGCAMLGQSYQYGEGVARSASFARGAFQKSCRIAPDFEACTFSKEGIDELAPKRGGS